MRFSLLLGHALRNSVDNLVHSTPLIEDDNKTAEEIEAEENARADQDNVLGAIGFVAGQVIGKIENSKVETHKATEIRMALKGDTVVYRGDE